MPGKLITLMSHVINMQMLEAPLNFKRVFEHSQRFNM